jgi:predicted transcriptional regulator
MPGTLMEALLIYIRIHPGVKGSELQTSFNGTKASISGSLARLHRMGLIENHGPRGTRWSEWYPVEVEPVDPKFLEIAQTLLKDLKRLLPTEREDFLARKLKEISSQ